MFMLARYKSFTALIFLQLRAFNNLNEIKHYYEDFFRRKRAINESRVKFKISDYLMNTEK